MTNIVIVGEAWGKDEAAEGRPFIGASGRLLNSMLSMVGISRDECYVTNVFNLQPRPTNDVSNLCGPKADGIPGMPALSNGKYVRAEYLPELSRLYDELTREAPNLILALGGSAAWAVCLTSGIRAIRGAPLATHPRVSARLGRVVKVLPTYHPAAVMRDYTLRPIVVADFAKAKREAEFPEIIRPRREIWVEPTLDDLARFEREHIDPSRELSVDIETKLDQITEVGFAPTKDVALVVPFWDRAKPDGNYWRSAAEEIAAWTWIKRQCAKRKTFTFQNGVFDMHLLWRRMGITFPNANNEDTMLAHHALQPEMEKGLGFLGSIYTDEASWKFMRKGNETLKRED